MDDEQGNGEPMGVAEADKAYEHIGKSNEDKAELDEHEVTDPTVSNPQQPQFPAPVGMPQGYTDDKPGYHGGHGAAPGGERTGVGDTSTAALADAQTVGDGSSAPEAPVDENGAPTQPPAPDGGAGALPAAGDQGVPPVTENPANVGTPQGGYDQPGTGQVEGQPSA